MVNRSFVTSIFEIINCKVVTPSNAGSAGVIVITLELIRSIPALNRSPEALNVNLPVLISEFFKIPEL